MSNTPTSIEIRAVLAELRWPNADSDWYFGKARLVDASNGRPSVIKITGNGSPEDVQLQTEYLLYGEWFDHDKHGRQFKLSYITKTTPLSQTGVLKYLQQAPHVGVSTAMQLWDKFGGDAVRILRETPHIAAAAVPGGWFTLDKAQQAAAKLAELVELENCMIKLHGMFDGHSFRKSLPQDLVRKYGGAAPEIIARDPYKLRHFSGVGFPKADNLYQELGLPLTKLKRQVICAVHEIEKDRDGNTWIPAEKATDSIKKYMGGADVDAPRALQLARRAKLIAVRMGKNDCPWCCGKDHGSDDPDCGVCRGTGSTMWVADYQKAKDENELAELIAKASLEPSIWPKIFKAGNDAGHFDKLDPEQFQELSTALSGGPVATLTGGPGCGKTFTAAPVVRTIVEMFGTGSICVAAPTGKASVRLNESMEEYELGVSATTEHRMLHVESVNDSGFSFYYRKNRPLPVRFLLLDEQSMKDVPLMLSVFRARGRGTHVLFIGDIDQLPPIGHGAPMRDIMAAGLPCGRLTKPHRNAGTIVRACSSIREGKPFETDDQLAVGEKPPRNLKLVHSVTALTPKFIIDILRKIKAGGNSDPIWDCQLICAVKVDGSKLSQGKLNKLLQAELNPSGSPVPGCDLRIGDKVSQLKNKFATLVDSETASGLGLKATDPGEVDDSCTTPEGARALICNGDFGKVVGFDEKHLFVNFITPSRLVALPLVKPRKSAGKKASKGASAADGEGENPEADQPEEIVGTGSVADLTLGYACTCHKMQGSQAKIVIVVLDDYPGAVGRWGVCKREWLYTAISRAQKACFLVGSMAIARAMCCEQALPNRKTFLTELILEHRERLIDLSVPSVPLGITGPAERELILPRIGSSHDEGMSLEDATDAYREAIFQIGQR